MTHTKPPHKPFTKKFWILLGSSVLSLLLVYGGIVWAVEYFREPPECSGKLATNCTVVGKKNSIYSTGNAADKQETTKLLPKESAKSNADDTGSNLWNKRLVITNADPARNYFIPLRTEREIVSAYKATLPNGVKGNQKDGGLFRKVNICAKGGAVYTNSAYSNEVVQKSLSIDIPQCPQPRLCFEQGRSCNTNADCRDTAGSQNICKKDIVAMGENGCVRRKNGDQSVNCSVLEHDACDNNAACQWQDLKYHTACECKIEVKDKFEFDADYMVVRYQFKDGRDLDIRARLVSPILSTDSSPNPFLGWGAARHVGEKLSPDMAAVPTTPLSLFGVAHADAEDSYFDCGV